MLILRVVRCSAGLNGGFWHRVGTTASPNKGNGLGTMREISSDLLILALPKAQTDQAKGTANHSESSPFRHLVQSCRSASAADGSGGKWGQQAKQQ